VEKIIMMAQCHLILIILFGSHPISNLRSIDNKISQKIKKWNYIDWSINGEIKNFFSVSVYFAGKRYYGIEVRDNNLSSTSTFLWSLESSNKWFSENGMELIPYKDWRSSKDISLQDLENLWTPKTPNQKTFQYILDNKIVIAYSIYPNPNYQSNLSLFHINTDGLKDIGFASCFDPWTAYQELDMFLGTILINDQDHMVKISDKFLITKHGFDAFSFRNQIHPGKPRGK
jgi:hypothetical protein